MRGRITHLCVCLLTAFAVWACDKKADPAPVDPAVPAAKTEAPAKPAATAAAKTEAPAGKAPPKAEPTAVAPTPAEPVKAAAIEVPTPNRPPAGARAKFVIEAMAKQTKDNVDEIFGGLPDDFVRVMVGETEPGHGEIVGKAAVIAHEKAFYEMAPDMKISATRVIEAGDWVVAQVVITGTNTGAMGADMPATNKPYGVEAALILHDGPDGRPHKETIYFDSATMLMQLGVIPSPMGEMALAAHAEKAEIVTGAANAKNEATWKAFAAGMTKATHADMARKHYAADFTYSDPSGQDVVGVDANIAHMDTMIYAMMPDWTFQVDAIASAGNIVVAQSTSTGTYNGGIPDFPAKPGKVTLHSFDIAEFDDAGKLKRLRVFGNGMEFMSQLGMLGGAGEMPDDEGDDPSDPDGDAALDEEIEAIDAELDKAMKDADAELDKAMKEADAELDKAMKEADAEIDKAMKELDGALDGASGEMKAAAEEIKKAVEDAKKQIKGNAP